MDENQIISSTIGDFGRWQLMISIFMGIMKITVGWFQLGIMALAPAQNFWCKKENVTNIWKNQTELNSCYIESDDGKKVQCTEFEYDTSIFSSTIIMEWDLVCSKRYYVELTQMSFMAGTLLGFIIFGGLADKYGRKIPLSAAIVIQGVTCFISAFSPWFSMFIIVRFILSIANGGVAVISLVMCIEIVSGKWSTIIPILYQIPFGFGAMALFGVVFFIKDWRNIQIFLSIFSTMLVLFLWFIPESPRWLLVTNQEEKAFSNEKSLLKKIAKFNRMEWNTEFELANFPLTDKSNDDKLKKDQDNKSLGMLFKDKNLRLKTILLCIDWFGLGFVFFGFFQYMGKISEHVFILFLLSNICIIPGAIVSLFVALHASRKKTIVAGQLITGISLLLFFAFPKGVYVNDWPRIVLSSMTIFLFAVFTPVLSLHTGEMFPTLVRNLGVGLAFSVFKIGTILAPLVLTLDRILPFLPLTVMGIICIVISLIVALLPETQNNEISNTDNSEM